MLIRLTITSFLLYSHLTLAQIHGHPGGGLPDVFNPDEWQIYCDRLQSDSLSLESKFKKLKGIEPKAHPSFDELLIKMIAEHTVSQIEKTKDGVIVKKPQDCMSCGDSSATKKYKAELQTLKEIQKIWIEAKREKIKCDWSKYKDLEKLNEVIKLYEK